MTRFKKFGVLAVVVFALSAIGPASALASQFTASATGSLAGKALESQVLTTNGGTVICNNAQTTGTITSIATYEQHVKVDYSLCAIFGFGGHISPATFLFTSGGAVHLKNTVTITPTFFGSSLCTTTIPPQVMSSVSYSNNGNNLIVQPNVTGIKYTTEGVFCGASGSNGTYEGRNEINRVGGGSVSYHH
jgi:hypothetical protein